LPRGLLIAGAALLLAILAWLIFGIGRGDRERLFTGYVVTDNLYLSSPIAGTVADLWVARGQRVAAGARLFRIDPTSLAARADQARAQIGEAQASAEANLAALSKARARFATAQAEAARADADLARYLAADHAKPGSVAKQQIDQARATAISARRDRDAARDDITAADAQIASAHASVARTRAGLTDAERQLHDLSPIAPAAGRIDDTLYQRGEWVAANAAVIALIPDDQIKVRFFVPQALVNGFKPGTRVAIACDGCPGGMAATVDRVASRPEYTPPVIYSLKTRDKLVFMVEAVPARPRLLVPGQPMDVTPVGGGR
jgi:HlyD family secretion protein